VVDTLAVVALSELAADNTGHHALDPLLAQDSILGGLECFCVVVVDTVECRRDRRLLGQVCGGLGDRHCGLAARERCKWLSVEEWRSGETYGGGGGGGYGACGVSWRVGDDALSVSLKQAAFGCPTMICWRWVSKQGWGCGSPLTASHPRSRRTNFIVRLSAIRLQLTMPYPYTLPTTSPASFAPHYTSPVYPSLPLLTTQHRGTVRNLLKARKRLPPSQQSTQLPQLLSALEAYLPYLLFLQASLHSGDVLPSDAPRPITPSWRTTITAPPFPGAPPKRCEREGLEYEIAFTLLTLGCAHTLTARSQLHDALSPTLPPEQKQTLLNGAIQHLLTSSAILTHSLSLARAPGTDDTWPADLSPSVLSSLASLSLSSATLLAVTKADPYPSYLLASSAKSTSDEYLYAPPQAPTGVKALLLSRICIAASVHAEKALGLLSTSTSRRKKQDDEVIPELPKFLDSLHRVARAKSCRFLAIDAEASGRVGEAIGWAQLARSILSASASSSATSKIKRELLERREKSALERGDARWGMDAGRLEETRTIEALEDKWKRSNDAVFFQEIVGASVLAARIPSGREVHSVKPWNAPTLDSAEKKALLGRGVEGLAEGVEGLGWGDSEDEDEESSSVSAKIPGGYY